MEYLDSEYIMSGAALSTGQKAKLPASRTPLREREEISAYFTRRKNSSSRALRRTFRTDISHRCSPCQTIIINAETFRESTVIPVSDSLQEAIQFATEGCAFFEWLGDLLILLEPSVEEDLFRGQGCVEIAFALRLAPGGSLGANLFFGSWAEFTKVDGKLTSEQLREGNLSVCAAEGWLSPRFI